jgi:hypothetical protein
VGGARPGRGPVNVVGRQPGLRAVLLHQSRQRRSPGPAPGPDVAGCGLALLDVDIGVQHNAGEVVGGVAGDQASVTITLASMAERGVTMVAQPPWVRLAAAARSGWTSQNISGCSSLSRCSVRDMPPAVWCSVRRYVVVT